MFRGIHHVAIAVRNLSDALAFYSGTLGLPVSRQAVVADQGVRAALLSVGADEIELLEPTNPAAGVARFLEKKGEGIHHLCVETTDVAAALAGAREANLQLIDQAPRPGLAGAIGFLHPAANHGLLIELAQPAHAAGSPGHPQSNALGIIGVETVLIGAKDSGAVAATLAKNFGGTARQVEGAFGKSHVVQIGRGRATVLDAGVLGRDEEGGRLLGGRTEGFLGVCLGIHNLDTGIRYFTDRSVPVEAGRSLARVGLHTHGVAVLLSGPA
jgi:methylmalonyl-CoA/ethylmalonyl-CoA epimerase